MDPRLLAFIGVTAILVLTPGMATAMVIRNTAAGGVRAGLLTAGGVALANATWAASAASGLAALLTHSPRTYTALRLGGAVCLGWLGVLSLRAAVARRRPKDGVSTPRAPSARTGAAAPLIEGYVTNLLNPAILIFYVASTPQFIAPGTPFVASFLSLAAIHIAMAFVCHSAYAAALGPAAQALERHGRSWMLHAASGAALLALAAQAAFFGA
jgi:threonine/homoserine/homoserine lactone efflux protein